MVLVRTYFSTQDILTELQQDIMLDVTLHKNKHLQHSGIQDRLNKVKFVLQYMEAKNHSPIQNNQSCNKCRTFDPKSVNLADFSVNTDQNQNSMNQVAQCINILQQVETQLNVQKQEIETLTAFIRQHSDFFGDVNRFQGLSRFNFDEQTIMYYQQIRDQTKLVVQIKNEDQKPVLKFDLQLLGTHIDNAQKTQETIMCLVSLINQYKKMLERSVFDKLEERQKKVIRAQMVAMHNNICASEHFSEEIQLCGGTGMLLFLQNLKPTNSCQSILQSEFLGKIFKIGDLDFNVYKAVQVDQVQNMILKMSKQIGEATSDTEFSEFLTKQDPRLSSDKNIPSSYYYTKRVLQGVNILKCKRKALSNIGHCIQKTTRLMEDEKVNVQFKVSARFYYKIGDIVEEIKFPLVDIYLWNRPKIDFFDQYKESLNYQARDYKTPVITYTYVDQSQMQQKLELLMDINSEKGDQIEETGNPIIIGFKSVNRTITAGCMI